MLPLNILLSSTQRFLDYSESIFYISLISTMKFVDKNTIDQGWTQEIMRVSTAIRKVNRWMVNWVAYLRKKIIPIKILGWTFFFLLNLNNRETTRLQVNFSRAKWVRSWILDPNVFAKGPFEVIELLPFTTLFHLTDPIRRLTLFDLNTYFPLILGRTFFFLFFHTYIYSFFVFKDLNCV